MLFWHQDGVLERVRTIGGLILVQSRWVVRRARKYALILSFTLFLFCQVRYAHAFVLVEDR